MSAVSENVWRPSRAQWTGPDGVVWQRRQRWSSEREAKRFVKRKSGMVAVESAASHTLTWLRPEERVAYWNAHVAGHVDDLERPVTTNDRGITYHVTTWNNDSGGRLTLLSEMC